MAPQSKKSSNKSSQNKKKSTVKKRTRKTSKKTSHFKKNIFVVLGVFLMISLVAFGYFLGQNDLSDNRSNLTQVDKSKELHTAKKLFNNLSKIKTEKPTDKETVTHSLVQERKKEQKRGKVPTKKKEISLAYRGKKPKLVIVIDDVSTQTQLKRIQALNMKITPSIFPPFERSKRSHRLAQSLEHYMIHLPMESGSLQFNKQYKTLKTTFSKEQIEARIKELRKLFPTAHYINNHTGSVFTDDYKAMRILYAILRKEGFVFVDSRTVGSTKVRKIAHEFGDAYVARDIFIDNKHNVPYIHSQLRHAVDIARKKGYAIAIGHPHKITMKALASAKDIFKEVELVYIDEIYRRK
jgi:polysaccharide deacetylase 2 family uncharacterized protein YibQ